ncbi:MAG: GGDEF domain-containing phosphodiesterase [Eubacteriales bacterium]|nr:GGDEF domain-containing phosphodiesterase [Eubacteriales bacterium]
MEYNVDFLVAGLIFLSLILYHYASQSRMADANNRIFRGFIVIGLLDLLMELVSILLLAEENPAAGQMTKLILTLLYVLQIVLPYGAYLYIRTMRSRIRFITEGIVSVVMIPSLVMLALVIGNYWTGILFSVENGVYVSGPMRLLMYVHALFYLGVVAVESVIYHRELGRRKLAVIAEFLILMTVCLVIQLCCARVPLTGFGIALGITVFFCTVNNPKEYLDNLTGVLDLRCFEELVQGMLERRKQFHLITVDMFYLRRVNMIYGNRMGNRILVEVAQKLMEISPECQVFRIKGNRFAVLTYSLTEYEEVRMQLQEYFSKDFHLDGEIIAFPVTICGIKDGARLSETDTMLQYMEYLTALPGARDETFLIQDDEKVMRGFRRSMEVEAYLKTAIQEDLFHVYYQPVYSIDQGEFVTLEALSRLSHPKLGALSPEVFISIAEKNGEIAQVGCLQFQRVCRFLKRHPELMERIQNVKFNLSPAELMTPGHCEWLLETIRTFELPYSWFQFEITETVATEYSENLYHAVRVFQKAGIGLCLDDFGSGYANLNTVLKLPFSAIKLDRSLLTGMRDDEKSALFYRNIVSALKNMGYQVISEGVELKSEMELLAGWGVNMIQGYYFSRPVCEADILKLILGDQDNKDNKEHNNDQKCKS